MRKTKVLTSLGLILTSSIPFSFAISCSNSGGGGIFYTQQQLPPIDVKTIIPNKMFAAKQDPELYANLKDDPFVITKNDNFFVYVQNNYVKFRFTKEFVDILVTPHNYTIEEYSKLIFQELNLSPSVEFMYPDYQFDFLIYTDAEYDALPSIGITHLDTNYPISIYPIKDATIHSQAMVYFLAHVCNEEYFQFEQTGIFSKPVPTGNQNCNDGKCTEFDKLVFNNISKELNSKGFKLKTYDELFPNISDFLPSYNDELNTDYSFLERWNSNINYNEIAETFANLLNRKISYNSFEWKILASPMSAMIELLKRFYNIYCLNLSSGLNTVLDPSSEMLHGTAQVFNFNFFDNNKPQESFDVMSTLFNNVMNLGANDNSCIYLTQDINNKIKIDKVNYKSFGNDFTENVSKLQVFDKKTNTVLHEYEIKHKPYPLGFNRNPFTDYEYKYVAPGAYLVDNNVNWDIGNHELKDINLKVILKNGQELPQDKMFVNAKIFNKSENIAYASAEQKNSDKYSHSKYLDQSFEWKDIAEFYK